MEEKIRKINKDAFANLKCSSCGEWFEASLQEMPKNCPKCGRPIHTMTCNRCGYTWELRKRRYPKVCANLKCKSPYYNRMYLQECKERHADVEVQSNDE